MYISLPLLPSHPPGRFAALLTALALLSGPVAARAEVEMLDGRAWLAHFEAWVDRALIRDERRVAIDALAPVDAEQRWRALYAYVDELATSLPRPAIMPSAVPALRLQGLGGPALAAARTAVRGDPDAAIEELSTPEAILSADGMHLRAQLLDQQGADLSPSRRLDVVDEYRYAISLRRNGPHAARARIRIAQILIELGWSREAAAELRPHLVDPLPEPFTVPSLVTFARAALEGREWEAALAAAELLLQQPLKPETRRYALRVRGDAQFELERFPHAITTYAVLLGLPGEDEDDASRRLRLAYALDEIGQIGAARATLRPVAAGSPGSRHGSLAALLLARLDAEGPASESTEQAMETLLRSDPEPSYAALAGYSLIELARARREPVVLVPAAVEPLIDPQSSDPAIALLGYQSALIEAKHEARSTTRDRLAQSIERLQPGPVQDLLLRELSTRVLARLADDMKEGRHSDPLLLDHAEQLLDPRRLENDMLMVAMEAFYASRRHVACARYAVVLEERDERAIPRGTAVWRQLLCNRGRGLPDSPATLERIERSGRAGPLGLAVATLGAELLLANGQEEAAAERYARALLALAEPQLVGPVLLRAGKLAARRGDPALAIRYLTRGLTATTNLKLADDPLRKSAIVALATLGRTEGRGEPLEVTVSRERRHVEPWWVNAYAYLGHRIGAARPPEGDDLFARASRSLEDTDTLNERLERVIRTNRKALEGR